MHKAWCISALCSEGDGSGKRAHTHTQTPTAKFERNAKRKRPIKFEKCRVSARKWLARAATWHLTVLLIDKPYDILCIEAVQSWPSVTFCGAEHPHLLRNRTDDTTPSSPSPKIVCRLLTHTTCKDNEPF